jgi:hypothetical protein
MTGHVDGLQRGRFGSDGGVGEEVAREVSVDVGDGDFEG